MAAAAAPASPARANLRTATSRHLPGTEAREHEAVCFKILNDCVRFVPNKIEICGSCALNLFQRQHVHELKYEFAQWKFKDLDIFMCEGIDYVAEVRFFESKLDEHGYKISKRQTARFVTPIDGAAELNRVIAAGETGQVRLIDYWIEGVPFPISLINTCGQFATIDQLLGSFDLR